jgi:peptidoglycan lytic transglycosylase
VRRWRTAAVCVSFGIAGMACHAWADDAPQSRKAVEAAAPRVAQEPPLTSPTGGGVVVHHDGCKEKGRASFYSRKFVDKKMANGKPFHPDSDAAASKTLPLGTTARVTNLENGQSATVTVQDRGPYVDGRILDVSPKTATKLGMRKKGTAPVIVAPIAVPQRDGSIKAGARAAETEITGPSTAIGPDADSD